MQQRHTLSIWIRSTAAEGNKGAHEVIATVEPGNRTVVGSYVPSDVADDLVADAVIAIETGAYSAEETRQLGQKLFAALFKDQVKELYTGLRQPRIRLIVDLPAAQRVPWELLHDGEDFVSLHAPFSRGMTIGDAAAPLRAELPLRLLVLDAFPEGSERLQNQLEVDGIQAALGELIDAGKASVSTISGVTVRNLQNAIREAAVTETPFHVVHFIGHGVQTNGSVSLLFEDDGPVPAGTRPGPVSVSPDDLLKLIRGDANADNEPDVKLVFLNACHSVASTTFATTKSFAPPLLNAGIPAVIGMQSAVLDDAAVSFASGFYEALADGVAIDEALAQARSLDAVLNPQFVSDIGVPTLYMRSQTGLLFELEAPPLPSSLPSPAPARPWWKRALAYVVNNAVQTVLGLLLVAGGTWAFNQFVLDDPVMDSTKFNVAIAEFDAAPDVDRQDAESLSRSLFGAINDDLLELGFTSVWGPDQTGVVRGATRDEREQTANERADAIKADVIVYGRLEPSASGVELVPEFYVNDRRSEYARAGASEIIGPYTLGPAEAVDPTDLSSANQRFATAMEGRSSALARFVMGLSLYAGSDPDYEGALDHFRAAESIEAWKRNEGREILYVFIGNAEGRLAASRLDDVAGFRLALSRAAAAYSESIEIDPEYSRAWLGQAEAAFHTAGGSTCSEDIDDGGMEVAASSFEQARAASVKPRHANVDESADFGLARISACQRVTGVPERNDPEALFGRVIAAYEAGNDRITDLAAESHGFLGRLAGLIGDTETAITEYDAGAQLLESVGGAHASNRRAVLIANAAFHRLQSGDCEGAANDFANALAIATDASLQTNIRNELTGLPCVE